MKASTKIMKSIVLSVVLTLVLALGITAQDQIPYEETQQSEWCGMLFYHFQNPEWALELSGIPVTAENVAWYRMLMFNYMAASSCQL